MFFRSSELGLVVGDAMMVNSREIRAYMHDK
jgi:hypothetical protein